MFGKSNAPPLVGKTDMLPPPVFPKLQPNAHLIAPTVSSKAAGVLGASPRPSTAAPPGKCHPALRQRKSPPRSQSAKSLPVPDLHDPHKQYRNRQRHHGSMPARKRTPSRPSKSFSQTQVEDSSNEVHNDASPGSSIPPTPPKKDTPKELKANQSTGEETEGRTHKQGENRENVDTPDFTTSESSIPSGGGESPNKYWPPTAEDYAKLIEQPYIASAQAVMSDAAIELEGDAYKDLFKGDDTEQQQKYPDWWNEEREKRFSSMKGETLPPTFYSPSVFSAHLFDGNPSQNVSAPIVVTLARVKRTFLDGCIPLHPHFRDPSPSSPLYYTTSSLHARLCASFPLYCSPTITSPLADIRSRPTLLVCSSEFLRCRGPPLLLRSIPTASVLLLIWSFRATPVRSTLSPT
jgi:hypothetical protein